VSVALVLLFVLTMQAQTSCHDISGNWLNTGTVQLVVTVNGAPQPQPPQAIDETFELVQTNCTVWRVDNPTQPGTISNNTWTATGPWAVGTGCDSYYKMVGVIRRDQIDWSETINGGCSGPGYVVIITGSGAGTMVRQPPLLKLSLTTTNTAVLSWPS